MALITRQITRTSQPQELVGLVRPLAAVVHGVSGNLGAIPLRASATVAKVVTPHGIGFNAGYFDRPGVVYPDSASVGNLLAACRTVNVSFVITSNAALQAIASEGDAPTSGSPKWLIQNNLGALRFYNGSDYQALGNVVLGKLHTVTIRYNDFSPYTTDVFLDGELKVSNTGYKLASYAYVGTGYPTGLTNGAVLLYNGQSGVIPSNAEIKSYADSPWQIFEPVNEALWIPDEVAAGDPTGNLAATESSQDTATFSGSLLAQGAVASTEATGDTAAIAGVALVQGALAATEAGADAAAFTGGAIASAVGTLAATESTNDTASISGSILAQGQLAAAEVGADTAQILGAGVTQAVGTMAALESGADVAALIGKSLAQGLMAAAEFGNDTVYIAGQVYVTGTLAAMETGQMCLQRSRVRLMSTYQAR